MKKLSIVIALAALALVSMPDMSRSQGLSAGQYGLFIDGGYAHPLSRLGERFKGTYSIGGGLVYGLSERFNAEIRIAYSKFDKVSGSPLEYTINVQDVRTTFTMPPDLEHWYRNVSLQPALLINLMTGGNVTPYIGLGTSLNRFDWYRGETRAWVKAEGSSTFDWYKDAVTGAMSAPYRAKHVNEWQWGLNGSFGLSFKAGANAVFDVKARYDAIFGDMWPALLIGLEGVRPITTLQLTAGVKFLL